MKSALCLGGNLFGSNPDATFAQQALGKLELVTYLNTTLNTGHAWGRGRGDADPAGAGPRRRAAADDAGIDVQLRPPQRRRPAAASTARAAKSTIIADARPSACSATRSPVDWTDDAELHATSAR